MSTTKDVVVSEYRRKCESEKSGQSVKGHIVRELQKLREVGEAIRVQRMQYSVEGGNVESTKIYRQKIWKNHNHRPKRAKVIFF